jgi:hypothetical protein
VPTIVVRSDAVSTISSGSFLPAQSGHAGEILSTDGAAASWVPQSPATKFYLAANFV